MNDRKRIGKRIAEARKEKKGVISGQTCRTGGHCTW